LCCRNIRWEDRVPLSLRHLAVRRLAPSFCGEVSGVDLSRLDDAAAKAVKAAWLAHKVLVFHDQDLDEDQLVAFARRLGEIEIHLR
jgi:taurine dioxygenase